MTVVIVSGTIRWSPTLSVAYLVKTKPLWLTLWQPNFFRKIWFILVLG